MDNPKNNSFFDSIQEMSKKPADLTTRTQVTNFAQSMCEYFNSLSVSMKAVQEECNFEIKNQADHINSLAQQIATLTKQINTLEVNGGTANDLRDSRNLLIDELSQICNVSVTENIVGADVGVTSYVVRIDSQLLVDTCDYNQLIAVPQKHLTNQTDADGLYTLKWSNGQDFGHVVRNSLIIHIPSDNHRRRILVPCNLRPFLKLKLINSNLRGLLRCQKACRGELDHGRRRAVGHRA